MRYLSVCSGIEAATVAWHPLGWTAVGFAEIDRFASEVLAARFGSNMPGEPLTQNGIPNFGDFTAIDLNQVGPVDLLVGGTPCQAFSFAGKRLSLADARGNLTLAYAVLAHELARSHGLRNALWENVPGVLSTKDNAFGCFMGALVGADAPVFPDEESKRVFEREVASGIHVDDRTSVKWPDAGMVAGPLARTAWRLLDAQYFGLAQRRERVFVVVDFGNGADPAAVLFEPQGMSGNTPPRRETGEGVAPTLAARTRGGGGLGTDFDCDGGLIAKPVLAGGHSNNPLDETLVAHTLRGEGFDASEDGGWRGTPLAPIAFDTTQITSKTNRSNPQPEDPCHPLTAKGHPPAIAFDCKASGRNGFGVGEVSPTLRAMNSKVGRDNGSGQVAVVYPLDMRQASRGEKLTNNRKAGSSGGAPGTGIGEDGDPSPTIAASHVPAVAYDLRGREGGAQFEGPHDTANMRAASGGSSRSYVQQGWAVRRLTPVECARLQGFPDHHSRIPWRGKSAEECPDGPQYKTYGNSMAVLAMRWLGRRLESVASAKGSP